ncbi:MAG: DUF2243 domain-containing protein [Alphaproteobacteria bacterium]
MTRGSRADAAPAADPDASGGRLKWAALSLGFALGGFFDGILLHQILQWHHLLSGLEGGRFADLRVQVLADGIFHALMYLVAAAGLWLLWTARHGLQTADAGRRLAAFGMFGFGMWHVIDAVASHWLLGIHRVRMDAEAPLLWDLIWLFAFGIAPALGGLAMLRSGGPGSGSPGVGSPGARGTRAAAAALTLMILVAGPVAALPPADTPVLVLFPPQTPSADIFAAIAAVDGRTVWSDPSGQVWAIEPGEGAQTWALLRHGAVPLGRGALPAGCLGWSQP